MRTVVDDGRRRSQVAASLANSHRTAEGLCGHDPLQVFLVNTRTEDNDSQKERLIRDTLRVD